MSRTILRIDSSALGDFSATRAVTDELVEKLAGPDDTVVVRDLALGVPAINGLLLANSALAVDERAPEAAADLAVADELISELMNADVIVVGAPMYNFSVPASLKAWADLVARAGTTFRYTEQGAEGLVPNSPVYIAAASGGLPIESPGDFGTAWLKAFLGFLGLTNVTVIPANGMAMDREAGLAKASEAIAAIS